MSEAGNQRVLSPEDATSWQYPRDVRMSPEGSRVAFVLADVSKPDEHKRSSIWMADVQEKTARQFTFGPRSDDSPSWSPDGSQLVFVSDRQEAGKFGLYSMSAEGGEAQRLTEWKGAVSAPKFSPDGTRVAFIGTDPETAEEEKRKKDRRDEVVADTNFKYGRVYVVPAEGGEARRISPEGEIHVKAFDWAPDGSGVVAVLVPTPRADDEFYGPVDLRFLPMAEGAEGRTIRRVNVGVEEPRFSPDGKTIAYRSKIGRVHVDDGIFLLPASGGEPRLLNPEYTGTIETFAWGPDGREIRFASYEELWGVLRSIDVETGELSHLLPESQRRHGSFHESLSFDRDGRCFAVVWSASDRPLNVYVGEVGKGIERVTNLNERLTGYPFVQAEPICWRSADELEIQGLLYRPVGFEEGKRYPLVVHIHGGPAWLWSDRFMADWHNWAQLLAQRGYVVLYPNPRGGTGRGPAFTDAEVEDMGGGELVDVLAGVDHVIGMGFVDPERMGVGGWSHGGYMTAWTVTQTDRFKCAVMGAGLSNLMSDQGQNDIPRCNDEYFNKTVYEDPGRYLKRSAVTHMRKAKTPTLILHGEKDERVAIPQAWEMYRGLKWAGTETQFVTYPREPHIIWEKQHQLDLLERVFVWFEKYLGTGPSSV